MNAMHLDVKKISAQILKKKFTKSTATPGNNSPNPARFSATAFREKTKRDFFPAYFIPVGSLNYCHPVIIILIYSRQPKINIKISYP